MLLLSYFSFLTLLKYLLALFSLAEVFLTHFLHLILVAQLQLLHTNLSFLGLLPCFD